MANPEIEAIDILLQEKMPNRAVITKEKKEKVEKIKPKDYQNYLEVSFNKPRINLNRTNTISNGNYTIFMKDNGEGYSKYNDILINRFKVTRDYKQGIFFYLKNVKNGRIWTNTPIDNIDESKIIFAPERDEFERIDAGIKTTTKIITAPDDAVEIRRLKIKNTGITEETLEVTSFLEPVLSTARQDYAHMAFNNLFLSYEKTENEEIIIKRNKRGLNEKDIYLGGAFYTENETIGQLEFEVDKEKFWGNIQNLIPKKVKESKPLSKNLGLVTDSCLAIIKKLLINWKK